MIIDSPTSDSQTLLESIAQPLAAGDLPPSRACEALADRLMLAGASAAAARWRSWALLPPEPSQLLAALGEATFVLQEPVGDQHTDWAPLLAALEQNRPPKELDGLVAAALDRPDALPPMDVVDGVVGRLEQAGAALAALRLLEVLWVEQRQLGMNAPALCNRMGRLWRQLGDHYQAELRFRLSLQQLPEQQLVWFQLAKTLLDQGQPDRALHSAEQGLTYHPGHDWGRKLRVNALRAMGGWGSLGHLQRQNLWPADAELCASLRAEMDAAERVETRVGPWGRSRPPICRDELRQLADEFSATDGPVLVLQGRRAQPVAWLANQGLWPEDRQVQPVASRDPWRVREHLESQGCEVAKDLPMLEACLGPKPALVVVERPVLGALPLELGPWMHDPEVSWLVPTELIRPRAHRLRWRGAGWWLWIAEECLP